MRLVLLGWLAVSPALAQFQSLEVAFEGIGCASCLESLPARIQRLRGVESATVDAGRAVLTVRLAAQNRVRLEQVRDFIEQDGTKAKRAVVRVSGKLSVQEGKCVLEPAGLGTGYEVDGAKDCSGGAVVTGEVGNLRPEGGKMAIRAREVRKTG